jgi:CBS-domain-containing membrane protein
VVDEVGKLLGIVTDRDACMAAWMRGGSLHSISIGEVMTRDLIVCGPDDDLEIAQDAMVARRVRRIPVVDAERRLLGIVSLNDLALATRSKPPKGEKALTPQRIAATLAAICAPHVRRDLPVPAASAAE